MNRRSTNMKVAFAATNVSYSEELHVALNGRRAEMDNAWDTLDKDWKELQNHVVTIGIKKPTSLKGGVVHLNVGGLNMTVRYKELESLHHNIEGGTTPWTLANLFDGVWDSRIPRDKDSRIFLDESPVILKHLVHTQLDSAPKTQEGRMSLDCAFPVLAADQRSYLRFFSSAVLGLKPPPFGMQVMGGSTMFKDDALADLSVHIKKWCPGGPRCLELIYRGSRDGFKAHSFHAKCTDDIPSIITLVKVENINVRHRCSSVVGGFSRVAWTPQDDQSPCSDSDGPFRWPMNTWHKKASPGAFVFMLKDGNVSGGESFEPVRWVLPPDPDGQAASVRCGSNMGPHFGKGTFVVEFKRNGRHTSCQLYTKSRDINTRCIAPQIQSLHRSAVTEMEVFRVCNELPAPGQRDDVPPTINSRDDKMIAPLVEDTRLFGISVAGALAEERTALNDARAELDLSKKTLEAAACALSTIYGPDIASNKPDPIVELSVRGARITTLCSTLQACPESALAARFDERRWPSDGKDFGVINCCPFVLAKVLDVLRMRKRVGWSWRGQAEMGFGAKTVAGCVAVPADDRESFEEFVGMYFPSCEYFIMDLVEFQGSR